MTDRKGAPSRRLLALLRTQQARYLMVGGYNTAVGYAVFGALLLLFGHHLHYTVVLVFAWLISTMNAFVAYRRVVFRVTGHFARDLLRFASVYSVALGVNIVALPIVVAVTHLPVFVAQGIVVIGTTFGTYTAHKYFSFRRPAVNTDDRPSPETGRPRTGDTSRPS